MARSGRVITFDSQRLRMAREAKGLTKQRLADAVGVTPAAVSQYEHDTSRPSAGVLAQIALVLGMPRGFFLAGRPVALADSHLAHFRSLRSTTLRDRRRALTHAAFAWELTNELENHLRLPPVAFPHAVLSDSATDPDIDSFAKTCREYFGIGSGPIANVIRLLESRGAIVVSLPVECRDVDAFSCILRGRPIVLLNSDKDDKARLRHSAAHELGHVVAHHDVDPGNQSIERQANAFASSFLLPADEIGPQLPRSLDWNQLIELKRHWGVSLASLLFRAKTLGVFSEHTYRRAFTTLNSRRHPDGSMWRFNEPGSLGIPEQPILLRHCVELVRERGVTRDDLAKKLFLPLELLDQLIGEEGRPIVKLDYPP